MVAGNTRASEGLHRSGANLASRLPLRVKTGNHQSEHMFSGLPLKADLRWLQTAVRVEGIRMGCLLVAIVRLGVWRHPDLGVRGGATERSCERIHLRPGEVRRGLDDDRNPML
jgi:hypothetical protein